MPIFRAVRAFALSLFMLCCVADAARGQVVAGRAETIHSVVLDEDREYQVYLPESYAWAKDRRYPVLYVLDGRTHFAHSSASAGFLADNGEIPEMIVVAIASTIRVRDFTQTDWPTHWIGGGGAANFKRFLSSELIPAVEKTYRADGFRVISGHSAGGQFVLYCLTAEPTLFHAYFALSPSLDWDDNLPQKSLEKSFESTPSLNRFLYVARSDDSGRPLADYDRLIETLASKSPQEFRWHGQPFPDETHGSIPLLGQIDALRQLYKGYRFHNDMMSKGFAFAETHFQNVSATVGWPLHVPERVVNNFGYDALSTGKTEEAIALFKRNVEANPNSANAFDSLADGYAEAGMWKDAAAASNRALALATEFNHSSLSYFATQAAKMNERLKQNVE